MRRLGIVIVVLALAAAGCGDGPDRSLGAHDQDSPGRADAVLLLDGRDRVAFAVSGHRLTLRHHSRAAGAWTAAYDLLPGGLDDRTCGRVRPVTDGRVVAVTLECDEHYAEDQAPTASVALASRDLVHWDRHDLEGEAYGAPAMAPDGEHAGWVDDTGLVSWHAGEFAQADRDPPGDPIGMDEAGHPIGATADADGGRCRLVLDGTTRTEVEVPLDPRTQGCEGASWASPDDVVVQGWGPRDVAHVHRDDEGGWTVGRRAPTGDGLVLEDDPDLPPVEVTDVDGVRSAVGVYDGRLASQLRAGDGWGPVTEVGEAQGCRWDGEQPPTSGSLLVTTTCPDGQVAWTSPEGETWTRHALGRAQVWRSPLGLRAVLPGDEAVGLGPDEVEPLPALHPCDAVLVDDDGAVLRVTGDPGSRGWPRRLQRAGGSGWVDLPVTVDVEPPPSACDHAFPVPPSPGGTLLGFSADPGAEDRRTSRYVVVEGSGEDLWLGRMIL